MKAVMKIDGLNKSINFIAEVVNVAEHTSYIEFVSRICYYDEPNLNGDMLPYDDTSLVKANTLINMPVQAKYRVNPDGTPTLGGHEMVKKKDGNVVFNTQSVGTHTNVWIKNDNVVVDGVVKELPCLFASYRIWKRYPNYIAAITRLFENKILYGSWELNVYQYVYDNGIRKLTDYEFIANCLLGETSYPSYGTNANAISMAETNNNAQLLIAEALSQDLIKNNSEKEDEPLMGENKKSTGAANTVNEPIVDPVADQTVAQTQTNGKGDEPVTNTAQLTVQDLRDKIREACRKKLGKWCYVSFMFPNEKEVWCEYDGAETLLDYVKFTYEVDSEDNVSVSEPEFVKLTVSIAEVNTKISSLEKEVETTKAELEIKNNAIIKASEKIQELNVQISELTPYKEQAEQAEQKRIEIEIAEEKEQLKARMLKGNLFTEAEIAEQNIASLIEARDVSAINNLIADKYVASFDLEEKNKEPETQIAEATHVVDGINSATASLEDDDVQIDARSLMRSVLFNK